MWKKEGPPEPQPVARPEPAARPEPVSSAERTAAAAPRATRERATIGRSITIRGEVSGDEDLLIQGRVDGSVHLKQHSITIGPEGEVKADIIGRVVTVEGSVEGNLSAEEQVILRSSAVVQGDIVAPRVVLEDGARFRGGVDMGETVDRSRNEAAARAAAARTPESVRPAPGAPDVPAQKELGASDEQKSTSGKTESESRRAAQVTR